MNVWYKYSVRILFCSLAALIFSVFLSETLHAQQLNCNQANDNFSDQPIANQVSILTQVYREAADYKGENVRLAADIYRPVFSWSNEQLRQRPLVILLYGGGLKFGSRKTGVLPIMADYLARRGYVAVCPDYRLGWKDADATIICGGGTESDYLDAHYRAMQDERALVQYLKRQAATIGFDTNRIFLAGVSSGATLVLSRLDADFISNSDNRSERLGALESFDGVLNQSTRVAGLISIAGANLSADVQQGFHTPVLMHHGTCDNAVPYRESRLAQCPNLGYFYGPGILHEALNLKGVCNRLETYCGFGHDFQSREDASGMLPLSLQYILSNSIQFMLDVMCNRCSSRQTLVNDVIDFTPSASCSRVDEVATCGKILPPDQLLVELHPDVIIQDRTVYLKTNFDFEREAEWMILSTDGKLLRVIPLVFPAGISRQTLQFPDLPKGIYPYQIVSGNRRWLSGKILKQ
jgi:acetyl esterase/lipase